MKSLTTGSAMTRLTPAAGGRDVGVGLIDAGGLDDKSPHGGCRYEDLERGAAGGAPRVLDLSRL
jgi:hypothetical protein